MTKINKKIIPMMEANLISLVSFIEEAEEENKAP